MMDMYQTQLLSKKHITIAAKLLAELHPVVIPTETVYGIAADARSNSACRKVFSVKGRAADNPLIVHFHSIKQIIEYDIVLTDALYFLLRKFTPGPLTVLAPTSSKIASVATAGLSTVAIRIPSHPIARALLKRCEFPLAAPSANISGAISATTASIAASNLYGRRVAAIVKGGATKYGVESTIIKDGGDTITIMRSGAISESVLRRYVNTLMKRHKLPPYSVKTNSMLDGLIPPVSFKAAKPHDIGMMLPSNPGRKHTDFQPLPPMQNAVAVKNSIKTAVIQQTATELQTAQQLSATYTEVKKHVIEVSDIANDANHYSPHQDSMSVSSEKKTDNHANTVVPGSKYRHYQPHAMVSLFSIPYTTIEATHRVNGRRFAKRQNQRSSIQYTHTDRDLSTSDRQFTHRNGLLITRTSFRLSIKNSLSVLSRINIIERKANERFETRCTQIHIPLSWQCLNITDMVMILSLKQYMRHLYFYYWAFDSIATQIIYVELPYKLDVTSSALGDRLVRSAL